MVLVVVFLIGLVSYALAIALATGLHWREQARWGLLSCFPGIFGFIMMSGAILSTANEAGFLKDLPDALKGFLFFVTAFLVGGLGPWGLGWLLTIILRQMTARRPARGVAAAWTTIEPLLAPLGSLR